MSSKRWRPPRLPADVTPNQLRALEKGANLIITDIRPDPLREPAARRLRRIAGPYVLVIFGVADDLSSKKLMSAVYDLANRGHSRESLA
jgi:hypothetical protein